MTDFDWPEWVIAAWLAYQAIYPIPGWIRDRELTSGWCTANIFVCFAMVAFLAYALGAGGFW